TLHQGRVLAEAVVATRREPAPQPQTLAQALARFAFSKTSEKLLLILDTGALIQQGITSQTSAAIAQEWHDSGATDPEVSSGVPIISLPQALLVAVPSRHGSLITTRQQMLAWQSGGNSNHPLPEWVENAIGEAASLGHDSSGRFSALIDWLERNDTDIFSAEDILTAKRDNASAIQPLTADGNDW